MKLATAVKCAGHLVMIMYKFCFLFVSKIHKQRSIAALSQKQKAAAQLDEAVKERNHWEQKTIAQQAKIERQLQVLTMCDHVHAQGGFKHSLLFVCLCSNKSVQFKGLINC